MSAPPSTSEGIQTYANQVEMCRDESNLLSAGERRRNLHREILVRALPVLVELGIVGPVVQDIAEVDRRVVAWAGAVRTRSRTLHH